MDMLDQIIYAGCWVVLVLYILTTTAAFTQRSCIACAAAFICSCLLFLNLCLFNTWFFLPALRYHLHEINLHGETVAEVLRAIFQNEAAWDIYLIILGSFGSWLAVYNAAGMLQTEIRETTTPYQRGRGARYFIELACRLYTYLGFRSLRMAKLPIAATTKICPEEKGLLSVFANTHCGQSSHFQATDEKRSTTMIIPPGYRRSLGTDKTHQFSESTNYIDLLCQTELGSTLY